MFDAETNVSVNDRIRPSHRVPVYLAQPHTQMAPPPSTAHQSRHCEFAASPSPLAFHTNPDARPARPAASLAKTHLNPRNNDAHSAPHAQYRASRRPPNPASAPRARYWLNLPPTGSASDPSFQPLPLKKTRVRKPLENPLAILMTRSAITRGQAPPEGSITPHPIHQ